MYFEQEGIKCAAYSTNMLDQTLINILKPSSNFKYHQVQHSVILHSSQIAFMYSVHISEQIATFTVNISNSFFFITEVESVYCAGRSESLYKTDYVSSLNS
jgi:hypothetical protein